MGSSGTRGVMSVLASFAARGKSLAKGPDERSGPQRWQSTKTRGRLAAPGVPALEAV
jgi:hypothetical protein